MDDDKRRQLEERRRFMQRRGAARELRAEMEPALGAMEAVGEAFRVYELGDGPAWSPPWIPAGYSQVPWRDLGGVGFRSVTDRATRAAALVALLAERLGPDDDLLFLPTGKRLSMAMPRAVFGRHADALLEAAWDAAYFAAPPASWLIEADWSEIWWKDS